MTKPRILAFSGSSRRESFNQRLVSTAARASEAAGGEVALINLGDFPLPLFNQDDEAEQGPPENMQRLKRLFLEHDGLLISAPEYNSSITPLLKNTLDWVSRKYGDEPPLAAYTGKTAAIISASPGGLGGMRGLVHVRAILNTLGVLVLPGQVSIRSAFSAFDADGNLENDADKQRIEALAQQLVTTMTRLTA